MSKSNYNPTGADLDALTERFGTDVSTLLATMSNKDEADKAVIVDVDLNGMHGRDDGFEPRKHDIGSTVRIMRTIEEEGICYFIALFDVGRLVILIEHEIDLS